MKKTMIGYMLATILVMSGCSLGTSTEKKLSDVMTDMNKSEKEYRDAQEQLTELEKSEQQLFVETMELTQEQLEELQLKVAALKESLDKRKELLNDEQTAIKKADETSTEFNTVISHADDKEKEKIEKLKELIDQRYERHAGFVNEYKELVKLQEDLYGMLIAEDTELTPLKNKVDEVNVQNEVVQSAISDFNAATVKANEMKKDVFSSLKEE